MWGYWGQFSSLPSCLLVTLQMRSLRAGKELNAGFSSCGQEGRKTVVTTIPFNIFWDTEGSVVKRSHLCPWPCPNVGYCSTCSCCYYSQRPMWKNYCLITLFPPEVCSFKGSLASFLWKSVRLSIFPQWANFLQNADIKTSMTNVSKSSCKEDVWGTKMRLLV